MGLVKLIDPDETLDYTVDWSDWLASGDTISTASWSVSPTGPTLSGDTSTTTTASTFIAGCTRAVVYQLTNRIVTAAARTAERSVTLRCEHR